MGRFNYRSTAGGIIRLNRDDANSDSLLDTYTPPAQNPRSNRNSGIESKIDSLKKETEVISLKLDQIILMLEKLDIISGL